MLSLSTDELEGFIRTAGFSLDQNSSHPKEYVNEGETIDYIVTEIIEKERKILLSVKNLTESPWNDI